MTQIGVEIKLPERRETIVKTIEGDIDFTLIDKITLIDYGAEDNPKRMLNLVSDVAKFSNIDYYEKKVAALEDELVKQRLNYMTEISKLEDQIKKFDLYD